MNNLKFSYLNWPLKLSLYIGLPSLAVIYYFLSKNKKKSDDDENSYQNLFTSKQSIIELKVPSECVRAIIGPQGSVIKQIQQKTNTRINLKDRNNNNANNKDPNGSNILLIRGSDVDVQRAELEIKRMISDMPVCLTEEYYIPDYACGRIIGKCGASIKELSSLSNCKIKIVDRAKSSNSFNDINNDCKMLVDSSFCFGKKLISFTGAIEQIQKAKELIIEKIKEEDTYKLKRAKRNSRRNNNYNSGQYERDEFNYRNMNFYKNQTYQSPNSSYSIASQSDSSFCSVKEAQIKLPEITDYESYLDENKCAEVFVSAVADPQAFWVQICNNEMHKLDRMTEEMTSFYSNSNQYIYNNLNELKVGILAACKFNKSWHRVRIEGLKTINYEHVDFETLTDDEITDNYLIDVYCVDFGDSAYVHLSNIKVLSTKFYGLPYQAIECGLYGVELNENNTLWSDEAVCYFEDIVYSCKWKRIILKLVDFEIKPSLGYKKPLIKLFDNRENCDITELLIHKKYAKAKLQENKETPIIDNPIINNDEIVVKNDQLDEGDAIISNDNDNEDKESLNLN